MIDEVALQVVWVIVWGLFVLIFLMFTDIWNKIVNPHKHYCTLISVVFAISSNVLLVLGINVISQVFEAK